MTHASERPRRKRLSWESRCEVVAAIEAGISPAVAAAGGGCSRATAYRLWRRYQAGGWLALRDRSSRPRRQPRRLAAEAEAAIVAARRRCGYGPVQLAGLLPTPSRWAVATLTPKAQTTISTCTLGQRRHKAPRK